jgi:hypothetical protein
MHILIICTNSDIISSKLMSECPSALKITIYHIPSYRQTLSKLYTIGVDKAGEIGADFLIISLGQAYISDLSLVKTKIESWRTSGAAVYIRYSEIRLDLSKFSPRMPFVDPHFMCFNLWHPAHKRIRQAGPTANHLFQGTQWINYELVGLIEKNFRRDEVLNVFDSSTLDMYGNRMTKLEPVPFSYWGDMGLLTAYDAFDLRIIRIIDLRVRSASPSLLDRLLLKYEKNI